jgi:hypothetical protein
MGSLIGTLISIILALIVLGLIWWAVMQLWPLIARYLAEPFLTIIRVLLVVVFVLIVLWVIIVLLGMAGVHIPGPFRF